MPYTMFVRPVGTISINFFGSTFFTTWLDWSGKHLLEFASVDEIYPEYYIIVEFPSGSGFDTSDTCTLAGLEEGWTCKV